MGKCLGCFLFPASLSIAPITLRLPCCAAMLRAGHCPRRVAFGFQRFPCLGCHAAPVMLRLPCRKPQSCARHAAPVLTPARAIRRQPRDGGIQF